MNADFISETNIDSRWRMAVLSANQAVWDHDFERQQHYLSDAWRTLRGLTIDDDIPLVTEEWLTTIHENDVGHIADEWRRIDAGETDIINYKFRQQHKDGRWIWFLSRGRVVRRDPTGLPARIVGTDTDITDIKIVELESQRMAQRLAVAMEAAGMGRWELYLDSGVAYWDDRLLEILAISDGKNLRRGSDWLQYIHPNDRTEIASYIDDCVEKRIDIARDYRVLNDAGETVHIRALAKFVDNKEVGPCYYGVNIDISADRIQAEELEKARVLLEYESRHDALTKVANRRKLEEVFSEHMARHGGSVSVMHFDIDHFKQINDTLGHAAGDATLKHAADVLQRHVNGNSLVARVGGDEFVALMLESLSQDDLRSTADAIIAEMSHPFRHGAQQPAISVSIGIATNQECDGGQDSLFVNADLALYEAKKAGRGRYRFYSSSMKKQVRSRKKIFDELSLGIERGEIICHYQPQFDASTLQVSGLEALVRWERGADGLIMPDEFLGVAEDMGILSEIDDLVLRRVLQDIDRWKCTGISVPPISVNVSSSRLNDPMFGGQLQALRIPKGMIAFELLESAFLDTQNNVVKENLGIAKRLGVNIEIDDFGTGHASITGLLEISPQRLKIDRSLVGPITTSEQQRELVKNILGIGHVLGIKVVAEGVETAAHIEILQAMRCDFLQGFGLSRPMNWSGSGQFLAASAATQYASAQS